MTTSMKQMYGTSNPGSAAIGGIITNPNGLSDPRYLPNHIPYILDKTLYPELYAVVGNKPMNTSNGQVSYSLLRGLGAINLMDAVYCSSGTVALYLNTNGSVERGNLSNGTRTNIAFDDGAAFANGAFCVSNPDATTGTCFIGSSYKTYTVNAASGNIANVGASPIHSGRWILQNGGYWSVNYTATLGQAEIVGGTVATISTYTARATYNITSGDGRCSDLFPISTDKIGFYYGHGSLPFVKLVTFTVSGNTATFDAAVDTNLRFMDKRGNVRVVSSDIFLFGNIDNNDNKYHFCYASTTTPTVFTKLNSPAIKPLDISEPVGRFFYSTPLLFVSTPNGLFYSPTPTNPLGWTSRIINQYGVYAASDYVYASDATNLVVSLFGKNGGAAFNHYYGTLTAPALTTIAAANTSTSNGSSLNCNSIDSDGSRTLLAANGQVSASCLYRSVDDARSWVTYSTTAMGIPAAAYWVRFANNTWITAYNSSPYASYSVDGGLTWFNCTGFPSNGYNYPPVWNGQRWVLTTPTGCYYSPNGITWVACTGAGIMPAYGGNSAVGNLACNSSGVCVRLVAFNIFQYTNDGITWYQSQAVPAGVTNGSVTCVNDVFIYNGYNSGVGTGVYGSSIDGDTWTFGIGLDPSNQAFMHQKSINGYCFHNNNSQGMSRNGLKYFGNFPWITNGGKDVCYHNGAYYFATMHGVRKVSSIYGYDATKYFYIPPAGIDTYVRVK